MRSIIVLFVIAGFVVIVGYAYWQQPSQRWDECPTNIACAKNRPANFFPKESTP